MILKWFFDRMVALLGLLVLWPVLVVVAIMVKVKMPGGPAFFVQKRVAYGRQKGICVHCGKHFEFEEMEADHITPWKEGGTTVAENCQMLCRNCNRIKGGK